MAFSLGELLFTLKADTAQLRTDMAQVKESVGDATEKIAKSAEFARNALELLGIAFGAREAIEWVRAQIEVADQANKTAQKIGIATEALTGLQYAAKLADVDSDSLQTSLVKLSKSAYDASYGMKEQQEAFEKINVSYKNSNGTLRDLDGILLDIADRFHGMSDGTEKAAIAQELFGRAGANLIPFLNEGRDGIAQLREEAEKLGVVINGETAKSAEEFNDNLTRLKASATGLANSLAAEMLPALNRITSAMIEAEKEGGFLRAAFIGLGGVAKEAFSRDNYTEIENVQAKISDLNKEISRLESHKDSGWTYIFGDEKLSAAIQDRKNKIAELNKELDHLMHPPEAAKPFSLQSLDVSGFIADTQTSVKYFVEGMTEAENAAEKAQKAEKEFNDQLLGDINKAGGAVEQTIDRLAEKATQDFFKSDQFKTDSASALESLNAQKQKIDDEKQATEQLEVWKQQKIEESQSATYKQQQIYIKQAAAADLGSAKDRLGIYTNMFAGVTAAGAQQNQTLFNLNKAAAAANIVVSTWAGSMKAYEQLGAYGAYAAAAIIASGAVALATVASTEYTGGGGGTTPSAAASGPVVNGNPVQQGNAAPTSNGAQAVPTTQIIIQGDIHSNDAERLLGDIKSLINDGDHTIIDINSRQAQDLRQGLA